MIKSQEGHTSEQGIYEVIDSIQPDLEATYNNLISEHSIKNLIKNLFQKVCYDQLNYTEISDEINTFIKNFIENLSNDLQTQIDNAMEVEKSLDNQILDLGNKKTQNENLIQENSLQISKLQYMNILQPDLYNKAVQAKKDLERNQQFNDSQIVHLQQNKQHAIDTITQLEQKLNTIKRFDNSCMTALIKDQIKQSVSVNFQEQIGRLKEFIEDSIATLNLLEKQNQSNTALGKFISMFTTYYSKQYENEINKYQNYIQANENKIEQLQNTLKIIDSSNVVQEPEMTISATQKIINSAQKAAQKAAQKIAKSKYEQEEKDIERAIMDGIVVPPQRSEEDLQDIPDQIALRRTYTQNDYRSRLSNTQNVNGLEL